MNKYFLRLEIGDYACANLQSQSISFFGANLTEK